MGRKRGSDIRPEFGGSAGSRVAIAALLFAASFALAGCVQSNSAAEPSASPKPASASPIPTPSSTSAAIPVYDPEGSAAQNLAYFNRVGHALLDHDEGADGQTIVNYFVAHGFDKKNMEITPDKTSIGLAAWNIEFSVKMNGTCLIGQAGNVKFESTTAPVMSTGKCLIGQTRTINW
jgi:hypothetical protein